MKGNKAQRKREREGVFGKSSFKILILIVTLILISLVRIIRLPNVAIVYNFKIKT